MRGVAGKEGKEVEAACGELNDAWETEWESWKTEGFLLLLAQPT